MSPPTPPATDSPSNYRFADLTLDIARRRVTRQGRPIDLKALDFDLLRFLVEQAPNVVNADVLAEKVWGRHFVSPENVAQRVMLLRQSLSDDAAKPRYIETVRNKGYRLIPVVEPVPVQTVHATSKHRRWLLPAATAMILLSLAVAAIWLAGAREPAVASPRLVAVLPFENLSADPDDAYFAAAMQDEIVSQLTKIDGIRVIAIRPADDLQLLVERDRDTVATLGGSVYYSEGRVRVIPRLTQAESGVSLWSRSYDRELSDIFAVQSEIALDVARALRLELSDTERRRLERVPDVDPRARDLYLRARARFDRTTRDEVLRAIDDIERALEIAPAFAQAWVFDAVWRSGAEFYDPEHAAEHRARAELAARRAVALDAESASAHAALGLILTMKGDWRGGEAANRQARSLNASPDVLSYGLLPFSVGKFAVARDLIEEIRDLQPRHPIVHRSSMFVHAALGDWATANELYESGMELFTPWRQGPSHWMHWLVARGELAKAREIPVDDPLNKAMLASLDAPDEALETLRREHEANGTSNPILSRDIAIWAGHFGDEALAFDAMRAALADQPGGQMVYIWMPQLAEMRRLPELKAYLRAIGMVDYWNEYGWPEICRRLGENDFNCD